AVVADGDRPPLRVQRHVDARRVPRLVGLDLPPRAGVVRVLDQLADPDLLGRVKVLREDLQQAGQVQVEPLAVTHRFAPGPGGRGQWSGQERSVAGALRSMFSLSLGPAPLTPDPSLTGCA